MAKSDKIRLVGGIGTIWGKQYHEQNRVYSTKGVGVSISAAMINGLYVKKWKSVSTK